VKVATLLDAYVHNSDHGCCAAECPDLDCGIPTGCLRFGKDTIVHLARNDARRIVRCPECLAAEAALRGVLDREAGRATE
jgi:hypothetical protein